MGAITFATPVLLLALVLLPVLWWLLRVTPPAPRSQQFPAIRLLGGLQAREETPARTPLWLLLLRVLAAGLVVVGLAGPVLNAATGLPGSGPMLLVVDDGWTSAPDWASREQAMSAALDAAERANRPVILLTTARTESDTPPAPTAPAMPGELRARVAALHPKPWPVDHAAAASALKNVRAGSVVYLADGIAAPGDAAWADALRAAGPVRELAQAVPQARLMLPPQSLAEGLRARISLPVASAAPLAVLAQTSDGRTLARAEANGSGEAGTPPGTAPGTATVDLKLPLPVRNRLARLVLEGPGSAGASVLLDERWRRRPVGLLAADAGADTPLIGSLFYLRRALEPFTELRQGELPALAAAGQNAVLVLADRPLNGEEAAALTKWVGDGGVLVRFAGPRLAEDTDVPLLPVKLLAGDRQLGGAMSWSSPARLAPFPPGSPFAGLPVPEEITVNRQVLAEPSTTLTERTWATLTDGTPLVTAAPVGKGRVVLFHVTANADWSNLPLSGVFVDMLRRVVELSAGVAGSPGDAVLAPADTLDGFGVLGPPPPLAGGLPGREVATAAPSPRHPPGLYGPENGRQALNIGATVSALEAAAPVAGAAQESLTGVARERSFGPALLAVALGLLVVDLLLSLGLRGLLRRRTVAASLLLLCVAASLPASAQVSPQDAALTPQLAYVLVDPAVDGVSRAGLAGLSVFVNRRSAATLGDPVGVHPAQDDLSFYPLLYWPVVPDAQADPATVAALNSYMAHGGIVLIDTRGGGSGEGFAPGADEALKRVTAGLAVPPLAPLTNDHVLARSFYLLQDFPGRFDGATVWVGRDQDRSNDSVTPVVIGAHDWAGAWAVDAAGRNPYATVPGGARQRTLAYRFGLNLVMYALTGNYKGDQVHVPAILERLGQ